MMRRANLGASTRSNLACVSPFILHSLFCLYFTLTFSLVAKSPTTETNKNPRGSISRRITIKEKGAAGIVVGVRKGNRANPFGSEPFSKTVTDNDGNYRLATLSVNNLPPGKYWSLAQITDENQISTIAKLRQPESATARTKLRRTAELQKIEIELKPCQNVSDYQISLRN